MNKQDGFSLLELTLSMAISALVISQTLNMYSEKIANQNFQISQLRLNQETRAVMSLISNDLKRHGYWAGNGVANNPHSNLYLEENCVIVSYDKNKDASTTPASNETIGYRLKQGKIQTRNGVSDCSSGRWEAINEVQQIKFDNFIIIAHDQSTCINLSHTPRSNCDPTDCQYAPYQKNDQLLKAKNLEFELSAALAQDAQQTVQLVTNINLPNPITIKANENGPTKRSVECT